MHPELDKTIVGSSSPNVGRSSAKKQQAVVALSTRTSSAKVVGSAAGVTRETLYNWHHQLLNHAPLKPMKKKREEAPMDQQREALLE
ncbi:hypothetical protein [Allopusillimonas ginsengisoli]|uniref:hypothetical protein n=1 Tax=Allopusillimonas ginsengisoli TaxID=453575 RepID=UPI00101F5525|nr:hypothetical protein [Allopusillimonas ginsengisoli]TEA79605.1 hypothetical protein ERE07_01225 [Allopusillimonas ginsengisoli]